MSAASVCAPLSSSVYEGVSHCTTPPHTVTHLHECRILKQRRVNEHRPSRDIRRLSIRPAADYHLPGHVSSLHLAEPAMHLHEVHVAEQHRVAERRQSFAISRLGVRSSLEQKLSRQRRLEERRKDAKAPLGSPPVRRLLRCEVPSILSRPSLRYPRRCRAEPGRQEFLGKLRVAARIAFMMSARPTSAA